MPDSLHLLCQRNSHIADYYGNFPFADLQQIRQSLNPGSIRIIRLRARLTSTHKLKTKLLDSVRAAARKHKLFQPGSSIVLAVSGGADSVCMTHLFNSLKKEMSLHLHMAHFDHNLRGDESRRDAMFSRNLAESMHIPFTLGTGNVMELAESRGLSVQEAARVLRYNFLEKVRKDTGSDFIATAHNADDQAEEVLLRLIRGTSLRGLCGVPWKRDATVIRPMLGVYGDDIRGFLKDSGIDYVEDSSNSSRKYLRNRVRLDLIPFIRENFNPAITEALNRTASLLSDDMDFIEAEASEAFEQCLEPDSAGASKITALNIERLVLFHPAIRRRIYRLAIERVQGLDGNLTSAHLFAIDRLILAELPSGDISLPGMMHARRSYNLLQIIKDEPCSTLPQSFDFKIYKPGCYKLPNGTGEITIEEGPLPQDFRLKKNPFPHTLYLAEDSISFPLGIRSRVPGDRFSPAGRGFECKLKKFLINCKIPRSVRDRIPLLVTGNEVIAVGGLEVSEHAAPYGKVDERCFIFTWLDYDNM